MKPEIERAMREVLEAWDTPDSPEAMVAAIYQMKRVYSNATKKPETIGDMLDRMQKNTNKQKMGHPRKAKA